MNEEKNKVAMEKLKLNLEELEQITGGRKSDDRLREYIRWSKDCGIPVRPLTKMWGMSLSEEEYERIDELWDTV